MKVTATFIVEHEAPDDATHFTGWLDGDDHTWWKFSVNSTGVCRHWCHWNKVRKEWMIHGESEPHFLNALPPEIQYARR